MGSGVTVARTEDTATIRDLVMSCWDTISEDDDKDWHPNLQKEAYLLALVDGEPAGVLSITSANASILHVHIHIDPKCRDQKYPIGRALVDYITKHSAFRSMIVYVPVIYPNVAGFAKRLGFVNAGTAKRGFMKDGELHDLEILQLELERAE